MGDAGNDWRIDGPPARPAPISPCESSLADDPGPSAVGSRIARVGAPLLHQQCWLWGWDIRDLEANLLLAHGFTRLRTPGVRDSAYTLHLSAGRSVVLWGWGVFYGDPAWGGVFVKRCGFDPRLTAAGDAPSSVSRPADLQPLTAPTTPSDWRRMSQLLPPLLRWIADYESWVRAERGDVYRRLSLRACPRFVVRRPVAAARVVATWMRLADQCAEVACRHAELKSA